MHSQRPNGFTLIELLIVIAIIAVLAAILFPAFASARKDARMATSISNLHQCGIALRLYVDDYGGVIQDLPPTDVVSKVLAKEPTCDPNDYWRTSCSQVFGNPLVGSYGYIIPVTDDPYDLPLSFINDINHGNPSILVSVFYSDSRSSPHQGDWETPLGPCYHDPSPVSCQMPDKVLRLFYSGTVKLTPNSYRASHGVIMSFDWIIIFFPQKGGLI
jgi:prepilin-type N-terminal cleavage/methylation domain-containing protein